MAHIDTSEYQGAPLPPDESQRLDVLCSLNILDTEKEQAYEDITVLCTKLFKLPIVLVSLVENDRQWFKSVQGLDVTQTERKVSFCAWTLLPDIPQVLVVENACEDVRFKDNYLVTGPPDIRFYGGSPLVLADGVRIGTLCLIDRVPRTFHHSAFGLLVNLADLVVRKVERERLLKKERLSKEEAVGQAIAQGALLVDTSGSEWDVLYANESAGDLTGIPTADLCAAPFQQSLHMAALSPAQRSNLRHFLDNQLDLSLKLWCLTADGVKVWLAAHLWPATRQNPQNIMPKVGFPATLDDSPSEFDKYYFVLLDRSSAHAEDATDLHLLASRLTVQETIEANLVDELELGDLVTAGKTWQLYRGIYEESLVSIKVKLAVVAGVQGLDALKRSMHRLVKKSKRLEHVVALNHFAVQDLPDDDSAAPTSNYTHLFDDTTRQHVASSHTSSLARSHSSANLSLASAAESPRELSVEASSPREEALAAEGAPLFVQVWLIQELGNRGTLADGVNRGWFFQLGSFNKAEKAAIVATAHEVATGLASLHAVGMSHLNLHASNIYLFPHPNTRSFVARLGDYGLALALTMAGAPLLGVCQLDFMAPELVLGEGTWARGVATQPGQVAADVYSFGVNVWCMVQGKLPFAGLSGEAIRQFYAQGGELSLPAQAPPSMERLFCLVTKCLARRPQDRFPSMQEVLAALSDC